MADYIYVATGRRPDPLDPRDVPRLRSLRALDHLIGHPVVVLEVFLFARHYVLVTHEGLRGSVLRQNEAVAQVSAVPIYSSLCHDIYTLPPFKLERSRVLLLLVRTPPVNAPATNRTCTLGRACPGWTHE